MRTDALLLEIGCEEIPARMIGPATGELCERVIEILDRAGLDHGPAQAWGGCRRLAVRIESVAGRQQDRDEEVTGPPARVAFDEAGRPTPAAVGFARKQGVEPGALLVLDTPKGRYAGFRRRLPGRALGEVLAADLPPAVEGMPFPKSMRWGNGSRRWVRPVHWVVALHGKRALPLELFGIRAGEASRGHRFLSAGAVPIEHPDRYEEALLAAHVVIDPARRRADLDRRLRAQAKDLGGLLVEDRSLLAEVADLVEWPAVVAGNFDEEYLDLPREILVTTLRYHQKCFSVQDGDGRLLPLFLAVSNNERDRGGHVRRGNEWVVSGRLEDARFFWNEDRRRPLETRRAALKGVALHARAGSYADKADRLQGLALAIARRAGLSQGDREAAGSAAGLCKIDLVTGTVGEFPELQGVAGGLLLREEGAPEQVWRAVYDHYRPVGPDDPLPSTPAGRVVSLADKLDSICRLIEIGEAPTGSRDPFGMRRAANGLFRIAVESGWPLSLAALRDLAAPGRSGEAVTAFLGERLENFLREQGYTANEIRSVLPVERSDEAAGWTLADIRARLDAVKAVRDREDFRHLVELTKRVANIQRRNGELLDRALAAGDVDYRDPEPAVRAIESMLETLRPEIDRRSSDGDYPAVIDALSGLVTPVDDFFEKALVIDPEQPDTTAHRLRVLARLRSVLTDHFDISELSGEADRRPA